MKLTDIAISNLKVRKVKMLFLITGMIIGVATIVALSTLTSSLQTQLTEHFEQQGVRLVLAPASEQFSISYSGVPVTSEVIYDTPYLPLDVLDQIRDHSAVGVVSPKLVVPVELDQANEQLAVGLEPEAESRLKSWWQVEKGELPGEDSVMLGKSAAENLDIDIGEQLLIEGQNFTVSGILAETGQVEDQLIFMAYNAAASFLPVSGRLSFVEFNLPGKVSGTAETEAILKELQTALPEGQLSEVKGQQEARRQVAERFTVFAALVAVIVFIIGCLIIMITMMSSVNERIKEIGIFRAMGFRQSHVARIILTEAGIVSVIAGITGYLLGMLAALIAASYLVQLEVEAVVAWDPFFALLVIMAAVVVGMLSSLYPAWRAAKFDPADALRHL